MTDHKTRVEIDRHRVVCLTCPWFAYDMAATRDQLAERGRQHRYATEARS